jgi:hypothetical protein
MLQSYIKYLLECLQPKNYVELGVTDGDAFACINCAAIGIGNYYNIQSSITIPLKLFRQTSEHFFNKNNLKRELNGQDIDFCFIDNAHHFEIVLKEIISLEKFSNSSSLIVLDNLLPANAEIASRIPKEGHWMGDVWKIIPILRKYRPDLQVFVVDDGGTGIGLISSCSSASTVLSENVATIIEENINFEFINRQKTVEILQAKAIDSIETKSFLAHILAARFIEIRHLDWSNNLLSQDSKQPKILFRDLKSENIVSKRYPPSFIDDPANLGFANHLDRPVDIDIDNNYCLAISNAKVIGFRSIITENNLFLNDQKITEPEEQKKLLDKLSNLEKIPPRNVYDEFTDFRCIENRFYSQKLKKIDVKISELTFSLASQEPSNYGSWLFRFLPKLSILEKLGLENIKIFAYSSTSWQKEFLQLMGINLDNIIHHNPDKVYFFEKLLVPSLKNSQAYIDKATQDFYNNFCKKIGIEKKPEKLIYVSRLHQNSQRPDYRAFINEKELIEALVKRGFMIFEPENHPLIEQIKIFSRAKMIVGPSGSGMFNCIFAPVGTVVVDIEAFPYWLHAHTNLFASLGHKYGLIIGEADETDPNPVHKRWRLNIEKTIDRIDRLLEELPRA